MKKWQLILLMVLTSLSVSVSTEAKDENWERISTSEKGETVYIDVHSIKEGSNGAKEAWYMYEYNPPNCTAVENQCISEITEYRRLYSNKTTCSLFVILAFTDATLSTHNLSCKTESVIPGTLSEKIWKSAYR